MRPSEHTDDLLRALTLSLAEQDEHTMQHMRRVAGLAVRVGERLGLPPGRLGALATGALLHDVGKLSVPDAILRKPGPLADDEHVVLERHPEQGARLLDELGGFPPAVRRLVLDHHERLDGSGYPRGLCGDELELDTRILAVCDVYDALTSPRVYRPAWTHDAAMELLRAEARAFDLPCVDALEAALDSGDEAATTAVAAGPPRRASLRASRRARARPAATA